MGYCAKIGRGAAVLLLLLGCMPLARAQDLTPSPPIKRWPAIFEVGADYVFLDYTPSQYTALSTTGSILNRVPGAIGQPATRFLNSDTNDPMHPALLATATWWVLDPESVCLQGTFLIASDRTRSATYQSNGVGAPLLARPYFDPVGKAEAVDPRATPGVKIGSVSDTITSNLMGAELNLRVYTPSVYEDGGGFNFFFGARWLRFQEVYSNFDTSTDLGFGGVSLTHTDRFATDNQFWAGQFGGELQYRFLGINLALLGKLAMGPVNQTVTISGRTVQKDLFDGSVIVDNRQGLYAQPSNVGTYHSTAFGFMPEASVKASLDVTQNLRLRVSYTIFALTQVVRPIDEINRNVNIQPLLVATPLNPALPGPPSFNQQFFRGQMLNVGVELRY